MYIKNKLESAKAYRLRQANDLEFMGIACRKFLREQYNILKTLFYLLIFSFPLLGQIDQQKRFNDLLQYYNEGEHLKFDTILDEYIANCINCSDSALAVAYTYLGKTQQYLVNAEKATYCYKLGEDFSKKISDVNLQFWVQVSLVEFERWKGRLNEANRRVKKLEVVVNNPEISLKNKAYFYNRWASILIESGDKSNISIDSLLSIHKKSLAISEQLNDTTMMTSALTDIGYCYEHLLNIGLAQQSYLKAIEYYKIKNNNRGVADVCTNLARMFMPTSRIKALFYIEMGIEACKEKKWSQPLFLLHQQKALLAQKNGDYKTAFNLLNEAYTTYFRKHLENVYSKSLAELEKKLALKDKEFEIEKQKANQVVLENKLEFEIEKQKKNRIYLLLAATVICLLLIISFLMRTQLRKIKSLANTKDFLIKEVHHRVKNNLQLLNSILYLQKKTAKNEEQKKWASDMQLRVEAISTSHHSLQNTVYTDEQDLSNYLHNLMNSLVGISEDYNSLPYILDVYPIVVPIDKISSIGMIVNELYSNTLKHASLNKDSKVKITLMLQNKNQLNFIYEELNTEKIVLKRDNMTMGRQIIEALGNQLGEIVMGDCYGLFQLKIKL